MDCLYLLRFWIPAADTYHFFPGSITDACTSTSLRLSPSATHFHQLQRKEHDN
jgi:hypothetical protein